MDVNNLFGVQGKIVLVTGGAKGIGRMIATGFVANGAKVYITGRDAPACHAAAKDLTSLARHGGSAHALPANLQHLAECESLVRQLAEREPAGLHVLVNNAGAAWGAPFDEHPDAAWTKLLTLNLHRAFTLSQLSLPLLERAGTSEDPARIIHIGSIDGVRVPTMANFAYSASKAGLHHLSRHMARDLGARNITSNVLACGPFRTKMMRATLDAVGDALAGEIPLGRIGRDEDVAGSAIFLSSKAGAYLNGALIRVDGGASLVAKI
ncbi:hypothetical protein C2857_003752 [Epichloe festucae Fl1]|uniref:Ketoreductase domain-containing protein n=1 Tax=Epichloe festucae (strain Fl1) TaxID=877507 RepID=A0A7U3Q0V6_EPIFF|nr:hypothetical protein C2857_003752 [Epichloe festucae Fl1]